MTKRHILAAAFSLAAVSAFATSDNLIQGVTAGLQGENPPIPGGFSGTVTPANQVFDDGTNGDVTSNDNVYTRQLTGLTPGLIFSWKVASDTWAPVNTPDSGGDNLRAKVPASGTVNFYLRTTAFNDGWAPDVSGTFSDGYNWSDSIRTFVESSAEVSAAGSFQSERGGNDWTPSETTTTLALTDAGNTTLSDGIFAGTMTGIPAGSYDYKILLDQNWGNSFGVNSLSSGGGNLSFPVIAPTDNITITLNANTGRIRVTNDNPLANPGPPFFAQSTAWGTAYGPLENMGSATGNVYVKTFTVATPGQHSVRIRQGLGRAFPDSGDYPFTTTTPNQDVRVVFDRNTYADGLTPATDIVAVVASTSSRSPLNTFSYVQPVGNIQHNLGGSDWDTSATLMQAYDDGLATHGDAVAGDGIFAAKLTALDEARLFAATRQVKAIATRTGTGDGGYTIQLGGAIDGLTVSGNNGAANVTFSGGDILTFQIDTVTGRVGAGVGLAAPTRPAALLPATASVTDWSTID